MQAFAAVWVILLLGACAATPSVERAGPAAMASPVAVDIDEGTTSIEQRSRRRARPGEIVFYRLHPNWRKVDRLCGARDRSYVVRHVNVGSELPEALSHALRALFHRHWGVPRSTIGDVIVRDSRAIVDIQARDELGWASTSCGSVSFKGSLLRTVFRFESIDSVRFLLDGTCRSFGEWLQSGRCETFDRTSI
ncbi:MAG: hypothetical protein ACLGIB_11885 [Actinomycetota bacterium]